MADVVDIVSDEEFVVLDDEEEGEIPVTPKKEFVDLESSLSDISDSLEEPSDKKMGNDNHVSIGKTSPKVTMEPDDNDDVEILYMRLQALQTMKDKLDQDDDELVEEMEELLQEADEAEAEEEQKSLILPIVDEAGMDMIIEDQKNDSMSSVVKRLKEAARKTRQIKPKKLEYDEFDDYSPAKSPDEFDDYSPAKSQEDYSPTQSPLRDVPMSDDIDLDKINPASPACSDDETVINPTDAEVQFFKQQREEPLFPSSVWEFQPKEEAEVVVKQEPRDDKAEDMANIEAFHKAVMEQSKAAQTFRRRKRARSKNNQTEEAAEDNEKALRAAVLSSMAVKRTKLIEEKEKQEEKSKLELQKKKKLQLAKKRQREEAFKRAKIERDLKQLQDELEKKYTDKSIKNKIEAMPLTRKHFPNLILRRVIISVKDMEEERRIQKSLEQKKSQQFQVNLDNLMKDLRSQATNKPVKAKKAKVPAPPKPVRKFPPKKPAELKSAAIQKKRVKKPSISLADKENLKKSNISHLPVDKQKEYKQLLALLAEKEKAKKTQSKQVKTEVQQTTAKPVAEQLKTETSKPQEVEDNRPLPEIEADLINVRKEICSSLFKLSAEMSQLNEESRKKETAEVFLEKLKNQVALTEELIARKNERIVKLKTVVSQSHQDIGQKSMVISRLKKKCKSLGEKLHGPAYQPPQEGIDTIKKKLSVINKSAQKVSNDKPASSSSSSSSSSEDSSSSDSSSEEDDDSRPSTLAHLSKSSVVLDPQVELCRYDLQGTCNDNACPYQHHRPSKS